MLSVGKWRSMERAETMMHIACRIAITTAARNRKKIRNQRIVMVTMERMFLLGPW